jgi:hypothetical protein
MMIAKKVAGMKTGIEIRLLGLGLWREAPHIRHTLALRETLAPQVGQCLLSSAILARFHCQFLQRSIATSQTKTTSAFFGSFPGKCSEPRPRGDFCRVTSLATPPRTGAESVFKDFPGELFGVFCAGRGVAPPLRGGGPLSPP